MATLKTEPDLIINTGASAENMTMAGHVCGRKCFLGGWAISESRTLIADQRWADIFITTDMICGLELLAVAQTLAGHTMPIEDKSITFYVGNNNALIALTKADSKRGIITVLTRLFWEVVARRMITHWSERVWLRTIAFRMFRLEKEFFHNRGFIVKSSYSGKGRWIPNIVRSANSRAHFPTRAY